MAENFGRRWRWLLLAAQHFRIEDFDKNVLMSLFDVLAQLGFPVGVEVAQEAGVRWPDGAAFSRVGDRIGRSRVRLPVIKDIPARK